MREREERPLRLSRREGTRPGNPGRLPQSLSAPRLPFLLFSKPSSDLASPPPRNSPSSWTHDASAVSVLVNWASLFFLEFLGFLGYLPSTAVFWGLLLPIVPSTSFSFPITSPVLLPNAAGFSARRFPTFSKFASLATAQHHRGRNLGTHLSGFPECRARSVVLFVCSEYIVVEVCIACGGWPPESRVRRFWPLLLTVHCV